MDKKIALLTGGTGFIGGHLARRLADAGWEVHLAVRKSSTRALPSGGLAGIHALNGGMDDLKQLIGAVSPSVIFHLASLFRAEHQPDEIAPMIESNLLFGTQLLEAAASCGVTNVVTAGTSWQNFAGDSYNPVCLYAATKQAFEDVARYYVEAKGLKLITLKLFDTYGPNDHRKKLFYAIMNAAASGQPLLLSPGEQLIDLVYVDDVVAAFELAGLRMLSGQCQPMEEYAVSSGNQISLRDLVELIARIGGLKLEVVWGGRLYREREVMAPWRGGKSLPGWVPKVRLEDGINNVFA